MERAKREQECPRSDAEWYIMRAQEENEANACTEIFRRLRRIYRVDSLQESPEIIEFLWDLTYFTYECEQHAEKKGLVLNPLTPMELESAFPLRTGLADVLLEGRAENPWEEQKSNDKLGLASVFRRTKGCSLKICMKNLARELRFAWQRAWKGYDDTDVYDLGFNLVQRMPVLLREFKKRNDTLFRDPVTRRNYTEAETDQIIDRIIFFL